MPSEHWNSPLILSGLLGFIAQRAGLLAMEPGLLVESFLVLGYIQT